MAPVTVSGFTERVTSYLKNRRFVAVRDGRHPAERLTRWIRFETTVEGIHYVFECTLVQLRAEHSFDDAQILLSFYGPGFRVDEVPIQGDVSVDDSVVYPVREAFNQARAIAAQLGDQLDALPTLVRLSQPAGRRKVA